MYPALEIALRLKRKCAGQKPYSRAFQGAFRSSGGGTNLRPSSS
jgi:hypothetical protein